MFKKGFIIGIILALIVVAIGGALVYKIDADSKKMDTVQVQNLKYTDLDGNSVTLDDFRREKPVLVNFWATWCAPCVAEFPIMNEAKKILGDEITFVVVSDESNEKIEKFAAKHDYNFVFLKTERLILNGITSLPQTFVLDKDLNKVKYHSSKFDDPAPVLADSIRLWLEN